MKQKYNSGDVFTVQLLDSTYSVGQVLKISRLALNSVFCAFFSMRLKEGQKPEYSEIVSSNIISILFVTRDLLDSKKWKVVANFPSVEVPSKINYEELEQNKFVGAKIIGSANVVKFLSAFHSIFPWNAFFKDNYFDNLLISPEKKPENLIFK